MNEDEQLATHKDRKEEYLFEQRLFGEFLEDNTFVGKVLKKNGYQIFDVHQAQEDFRKVMKLDDITEIAGVYNTTEFENDMPVKTEHIKKITKSNFYNAFYEPIWENLSNSEKIKSLEWMFENINEKYNLGIKQINYVVNDNMGVDVVLERDWKNLHGFFNRDNNVIFLNLDFLSKPISYFSMPLILAHELMHARQYSYIKNFNYNGPIDFYTISQSKLANISYFDLKLTYFLDYATIFALYRTSKSEKVAELVGLKTINKIKKLNQKDFEPNALIDKSINSTYEMIKNESLFGKIKLTETKNGKEIEATQGIVLNEEVVLKGQSENLMKLIILKNYYESKLGILNELNESNKNVEIENSISDCKEKLAMIKSTFISTLENGKLPEDFDEKKEFEILNLIEEPAKEYSLPRWLREDEDKNKSYIDEQKKKFEKILELNKKNEPTR